VPLVVALRVGLVIAGLSPFVYPLARPAAPAAVASALDTIFALVCHRDPARTLWIAGALMPLCSRCAGIFVGFVTGGLVPLPRWNVRACLGWGFVASVIMLADVITQDLQLRPLFHPARLATGVLWGHVAALGILAIARWIQGKSGFGA
jgi:uncharacterized membrane protein